jgi:hypothetical protein
MNKLVTGKEVTEAKTALYAGTITATVAAEFTQFVKVYATMPRIEHIIEDPANYMLPGDNSTMWAVITSLTTKITEKNFEALAQYASRFDLPFRVLFFRMVMVSKPELRNHPAFQQAAISLSKYLVG